MKPDPIVFAMANPDPEITPEEAGSAVRVFATGRSDYPNQLNNVLAFPGIFPRSAGCPCQNDQRIDEAGRGPCDRFDRHAGRTERRIHHPKRIQRQSRTGRPARGHPEAINEGVARKVPSDFRNLD